jgi:hypothetical protein
VPFRTSSRCGSAGESVSIASNEPSAVTRSGSERHDPYAPRHSSSPRRCARPRTRRPGRGAARGRTAARPRSGGFRIPRETTPRQDPDDAHTTLSCDETPHRPRKERERREEEIRHGRASASRRRRRWRAAAVVAHVRVPLPPKRTAQTIACHLRGVPVCARTSTEVARWTTCAFVTISLRDACAGRDDSEI